MTHENLQLTEDHFLSVAENECIHCILNEETNKRHETQINEIKLKLTSKEVEFEKQMQQQYDELEDLDKTYDEESKFALDELNGAASGNMFDETQEAEYDEIDNA